MTKTILTSVAISILVLFGLMVFSSLLLNNRAEKRGFVHLYEKMQDSETYKVSSAHDNLNIFIIRLKNPALSYDGPVQFSLSENGVLLRSVDLNGFNVGDPSDVRVQFEPIADSANKSYELTVYAQGELMKGVSSDGEIALDIYYRTNNKLNSLALSIGILFTKLFGDFRFLSIWAVTVSSTLWILSRKRTI